MSQSTQDPNGGVVPVPQGYFIPFVVQQAPPWTVREIWDALWQHRIAIAVCGFGAGALMLVAALLMTPVWRVDVTLAVVDTEGSSAGLSSLVGGLSGIASLAGVNLGGTGGGRQEHIASLRSRALVEQFIRDKNLLPVLFADDWDAAGKRWLLEPDEVPSIGDGYRRFDRNVRFVSENAETGLITLAIEWQDRELAAQWAADLVRLANDRIRAQVIRDAESSLKYLNEQLARTSVVEVQQAIYDVIESQIKSMMLASTREDYAFRVIDPAVVPQPEDKVRPKVPVMVAVGGVLGGLAGMTWALLLHARRRAPR